MTASHSAGVHANGGTARVESSSELRLSRASSNPGTYVPPSLFRKKRACASTRRVAIGTTRVIAKRRRPRSFERGLQTTSGELQVLPSLQRREPPGGGSDC